MDFISFRDFLAGCRSQSFDSNNAWGFGGATGIRYVRENVVIKVGNAFYRHLRSHGFITVTINGRRVVDDLNTPATEREAFEVLSAHFANA